MRLNTGLIFWIRIISIITVKARRRSEELSRASREIRLFFRQRSGCITIIPKKRKTDYIDFYFSHGLKWEDHLKYGKLFLRFTEKALNQGLIRYRGFSSHDKPENIKKLITSGEFSAMLVQYNILDGS